jgi:hypothetical protein
MKIGNRFYRLKTQQEWIEDAKRQHGDRYDYSKVVYVKNNERLEIICSKHGPFNQSAGVHIAGGGCPRCAVDVQNSKKLLSQDEAILRMKEVHGDLYDYSKAVYVRTSDKMEIICKKHGSFFMPYGRHVSASAGCPKCAGNHRYTTEEYIALAKSTHGDKFDYSKTIYVNLKTPVIIGCPEHGFSSLMPMSHIKRGCTHCNKTKTRVGKRKGNYRITQEEYLERIKNNFGDEYDLSKLKFVNWKTGVLIGCKTHGFVEMNPHGLLYQKDRCRLCRGFDQTTESWIQKAKAIHGDKFDYSESHYTGMVKKIKIICPTHGPFYQNAGGHILSGGRGCAECSGVKKLSREEFIKKSSLVHNNKYDYSRIDYDNNKAHIEIICPIHGTFSQRPDRHLQGDGCSKCGKISMADIRRTTFSDFLEKVKKVHGNKYTYPDFTETFISVDGTPIEIICKKHGKFIQTVHSHLSGAGCPVCCASRGEHKILMWLLKHNIGYQIQKGFPNCRNPKTGYPLKYDFYLPIHNILIEYDGEQHFKECVGGHVGPKHKITEKEIESCQFRDKVKTNYAKKENIELLRIPYTEIKNIDVIMDKRVRKSLTSSESVVYFWS